METPLAGTTKSRNISNDMPSMCTRCCDSTKTSYTLDNGAPSKGEIAVSNLFFGATAAMTRSFMSGGNRLERGRLYSKYDDVEAADDEIDGSEEDDSCGRDELEDG